MFHQVEGLLVDEGMTFADLKGTLAAFARGFFGPGTRTRFRPSYFPFIEPARRSTSPASSAAGGAAGQALFHCKETGWLEVLGSGMVHPKVLSRRRARPDTA